MTTEREWQHIVVDVARSYGWRDFHVSDSRRQLRNGAWVGDRSIAGFPDLVLVHPQKGFVFAELKSAKGRLTEVQRGVLADLSEAADGVPGVRVHVWRPDDLDGVVAVLSGRER